jgi:hypothetical protein
MVQIGICAFRCGMIKECHNALNVGSLHICFRENVMMKIFRKYLVVYAMSY